MHEFNKDEENNKKSLAGTCTYFGIFRIKIRFIMGLATSKVVLITTSIIKCMHTLHSRIIVFGVQLYCMEEGQLC